MFIRIKHLFIHIENLYNKIKYKSINMIVPENCNLVKYNSDYVTISEYTKVYEFINGKYIPYKITKELGITENNIDEFTFKLDDPDVKHIHVFKDGVEIADIFFKYTIFENKILIEKK